MLCMILHEIVYDNEYDKLPNHKLENTCMLKSIMEIIAENTHLPNF